MNLNCFDPASCFYPLTNCLRSKSSRESEDPKPATKSSSFTKVSSGVKSNLSIGVSNSPLDVLPRASDAVCREIQPDHGSAPLASVLQAYAPSIAQLLSRSEPGSVSTLHSQPWCQLRRGDLHPLECSFDAKPTHSQLYTQVDPIFTEIRITVETERRPAQYENPRANLEPVTWATPSASLPTVRPKLPACQTSASANHTSSFVPQFSAVTNDTGRKSSSASVTSAATPSLHEDAHHNSASVPSTTESTTQTSAPVPTNASVTITSTSVPRTSTTVPHSSASVPQPSATVPHSSASVPQSSTVVPTTCTSVPKTSASVPQPSATVPHSSASVPQSSATVPHSSASVPQSSATVPHSSASVPQSSATVPHSSASVPQSSATVPHSSASVPQSSATVPHSSASVPQSSTVVSTTCTSVPKTSASVPQPSASACVDSPAAYVPAKADTRRPVHAEGEQENKEKIAKPDSAPIRAHGDTAEDGAKQCVKVSNNQLKSRTTSHWLPSPDIEIFPQLNCGHQNWCSWKKPKKASLKGHPCRTGAIKDVLWEDSIHLKDGGFGEIYCVSYKGQKTAIKVQELSAQAIDEIDFLRNMKPHPNIMPLKLFAFSTTHTVSLSPLAVTDVNNVVKYCKRFRVHTQFITASTLCAINHLHQRNIAHRDIKEHNILLMRDGTPVLTDFGVAAKFDPRSQKCPRAEYPIGSRGYKSPEVARGLLSGPAMDLWALGCVMCRCINGRIPHDYINARHGMTYMEENYNIKTVGKFQFLDLAKLYRLSAEEKTVINACFIDNEAERTAAVREAMHSEYFRDIDMSTINCGYKLPKHHGRLQQLLEKYIRAHGKNPFHADRTEHK